MSPDCCYVFSLKYSPVHLTLSLAFGRGMSASGRSVHYILSTAYKKLADAPRVDVDYLMQSDTAAALVGDVLKFVPLHWARLRRLFAQRPPALLFFTNPHPLNFLVGRLARRMNPSVTIINLVHEPYKDDKRVYGALKAGYISLVEYFQSLAIRQSDYIILPSVTAQRAFTAAYSALKRTTKVVPLLFDDRPAPTAKRRYVSFIGHAAKVKGIDRFFALVEASAQLGLAIEFQIATSSDIDARLSRLSEQGRARLHVVNAPVLEDALIHRAAAESICVLALYTTVMQSAVVPVAYMNGAPVIATALDGLTEFVRHGETGWIVPAAATDAEVFAAIDSVSAQLEVLSARCRQAFEKTFDSRNWNRYYDWLIGTEAAPAVTENVKLLQ